MADNDTMLLDLILDERQKNSYPSTDIGEVFEYFVYEQILKDYGFSQEELTDGIVDGSNDLGIDAIYIFVNGILLQDIESFHWPKSGCDLEVNFFTCKHLNSFKMATIDCIYASIIEFFDFSKNNLELMIEFNDDILRKRKILMAAYSLLASKISLFKINIYYSSRGDGENIASNINAKSNLLISKLKLYFPTCEPNFIYVGSKQLLLSFRKKIEYNINLKYDSIISQDNSYITLTRLKDYFNFITEEKKNLKRYLFDSNVRDYMGLNQVNQDIITTLEGEKTPNFWWLNNGITILSTQGVIIGKELQLENVQIVNGLQTTEAIFSYYNCNMKKLENEDRTILVKIIISNDLETRDLIIRSTNNQTLVQLSSLRATDKIQRDIEEIMLRNGLYYERRDNYYLNHGKDIDKIFTPLYLASGYTSLVLKKIHRANSLKARFMRDDNKYNIVFNGEVDLKVWPMISKILKLTDHFLEEKRIKKRNTEKFLKHSRHLVSFLTISRIFNTFSFNLKQLINFDLSKYTTDELEKTWDFIINCEWFDTNEVFIWKNQRFINEICKQAAVTFEISNVEIFYKKDPFKKATTTMKLKKENFTKYLIDEDFLKIVEQALPAQPWPKKVHYIVAEKISCHPKKAQKAISALVKQGRKYKQVDGKLFDLEDNPIIK